MLSAFNCENEEQTHHRRRRRKEELGQLQLGVQLADKSEARFIRYDITRDEEPIRDGRMVVQEDRSASVVEANLEPGDGYRVDVTAARSRKFLEEGCRAITSFEVIGGVNTPLPITFQCESTAPEDQDP
ncbi:MAG TPA: hypothetical protein VI299_10270 [Polyangiales bacterium]